METNAIFRAQARGALKGRWQTALVMAFIASLPNLLLNVVTTLQQNNAVQLANDYLSGGYPAAYAQERLLAALSARLPWQTGLNLLSLLLTPVLVLGLYRYYLNLLAGKAPEGFPILGCKDRYFRSVGLYAMMGLKVLLWFLPGAAAVAVVMYLALSNGLTRDGGWLLTAVSMAAPILFIAGAALAVMAVYRYMLAPFIMAQDPAATVMGSIRRSKALTQGHKAQLFWLQVSFLGWALLITLAASLFNSIHAVLGMTAQMFLSLALNVYIAASEGAFYLALLPGSEGQKEEIP